MNAPRPKGRRAPATAALAALALVASGLIAGSSTQAVAAGSAQPTKLYIVQAIDAPVATYDGKVSGYTATRTAQGKRLDAHSSSATAYRRYLTGKHDKALRAAGINPATKAYDYGVTFNGFAVRLTAAEAQKLAKTSGIKKLWESQTYTADTTTTRDFLGLTGKNGVWNQQFHGDKRAGEGVIVGVIDSGIWPESASFAPLSEPRPDAKTIAAKWHGTCDSGVEAPVPCNNKLIGARYYREGFPEIEDFEFDSPRDYGGHGSHTSSTAAGDFGVKATIGGNDVGSISGMAPAARLAMYKALWQGADGSGHGQEIDLVAAIEQATADGVDVINYSISGSSAYIVAGAEIAFFNAAAAGVFVSASAGNDGDTIGESSVAHNDPWITTVAASTHDRGNAKSVTLGNGSTYTGIGTIPAAVASSPLVYSSAVKKAEADPTQAQLCYVGTLDPALTAGKIVVCDRGGNARVEKSLAVKDAGGVGVVLANTSAAQSLNGDDHFLPTVHLDSTAGAAVRAYAQTAGATASLSAVDTAKVRAPQMAGFSSYGPAIAGNGDLLKPDITAPGVDVIASVAPTAANYGNSFATYSGTSMSSPHIAGLAALLIAKHPDWSPMAVKSALMTTASTKDNQGKPIQWAFGDATPLNFGSGHVTPAPAFDPGLVYDSTPTDWIAYGCALGQFQLITDPSFCASYPTVDPSDLNYPSIAVGDLAGAQTIKRSVTNVTKRAGVYLPIVSAPAGFKIKVNPPLLVVAPGKTKGYTVTITRTTAAIGEWAFGSLTWQEFGTGKHKVRSPIAVKPVSLAVSPEITGSSAAGSVAVPVKSGFAGTLSTILAGLVPAEVTSHSLDPAGPAFDDASPAASSRTAKLTVTVPAGTVGRYSTFNADYAGATDTDLYAYTAGTANEVTLSAGGDANETMILGPGTYDLYVVLFGSTAGPLDVKLNGWTLGSTSAGNATVSPTSQAVTVGGTASLTVSWTGLTPGVRYLGKLTYSDGTSAIGSSYLLVG
ncbi:S8 family peptidase [Hamadaea sp. NPDC050747]|uniref:S8 family peptidase n=1 Tax=Hamadaea sp. NPDC050747 TaxID=3155789 RepID=UPI0033C69F6E